MTAFTHLKCMFVNCQKFKDDRSAICIGLVMQKAVQELLPLLLYSQVLAQRHEGTQSPAKHNMNQRKSQGKYWAMVGEREHCGW